CQRQACYSLSRKSAHRLGNKRTPLRRSRSRSHRSEETAPRSAAEGIRGARMTHEPDCGIYSTHDSETVRKLRESSTHLSALVIQGRNRSTPRRSTQNEQPRDLAITQGKHCGGEREIRLRRTYRRSGEDGDPSSQNHLWLRRRGGDGRRW